MTQFIVLLICIGISFFGAKSTAYKAHLQFTKCGPDWQKLCWTMSKFLGLIVVCGFFASLVCRGRFALITFLISIAATVIGQMTGTALAKRKSEK